MSGKARFIKKAIDLLDLPGELIPGLPAIEITGLSRIKIENHKGLMEYGTEKVEINGGKAVIRITGNGLKIRAMNAEVLSITGDIFQMEFAYK
jgi:sporulation protein YqfC